MEHDIVDDMENLSDCVWEQIQNCDLTEPSAIISVLSSVLCEFAVEQNFSEAELLEGIKECYEYAVFHYGSDGPQ